MDHFVLSAKEQIFAVIVCSLRCHTNKGEEGLASEIIASALPLLFGSTGEDSSADVSTGGHADLTGSGSGLRWKTSSIIGTLLADSRRVDDILICGGAKQALSTSTLMLLYDKITAD
ncbi:hypothetical protein ACJX0J_039380 [Zea mays]